MNTNTKKQVVLAISVVGFISFFLPWVKMGFLGNYNGYDIFSFIKDFDSIAYSLFLFPLSFLAIILIKSNIIKNVNSIILKIFEIIPILLIFYFLIRFSDLSKISSGRGIDFDFLEILSIGFYLNIISSILILIDLMKEKTSISIK